MSDLLALSTRIGFVTVMLLLLPGCGPKTVPVSGQVKIKNDSATGKLQGYGVMLEQAEAGADGKRLSATGEIDAEGKFTVGTHRGNDGAYPGKYRVAITPSSEFTEGAVPPAVIDRKYYRLETSGLEVTVEDQATEFHWELDPADK